MILPLKDLKKIAKMTVKNMQIERKPNSGVELARKRFGKIIDKFLRMKKFSNKNLKEKEKRVIRKLQDPDYGPLIIERNGKFSMKTEIGQIVRLTYSDVNEECKKLAKLIEEECWKRGVHVTDSTYSSAESRKHLQLIPFDTAAELPPVSKLFASGYDARIFLGGDEDINWIRGLEDKTKLGAPASQKIHEIVDKKKVRWCYFGWPIERLSSQMIVNKNKYRKVFYNSIKETFSPKVRKLCNYYRKALENTDKIKIVADDTDLSFEISGRPILVADGIIDAEDMRRGDVGLNIPDGEVFLAPLEHSANGHIVFDYVNAEGFGFIRNLKLRFRNGKVVWFNASSKDRRIFKKFLDSNTGEKDRIAELGIGTNPAAEFVGRTIVDEKIFGSIHIAIGNNRGAYHGKNKASSHLDMIKIMRGKNGKMYAGNKLIMDNGLPVGLK